MKKFLAILFSALCIFGIGYFVDSSSIPEIDNDNADMEAPMQAPIPLPAFSYTTLDGATKSVQSLKGKVIILNFWASWCAPCKEEFPEMIKIARSNADVVLLAISNDENLKDVKSFLGSLKSENIDIKATNIIIAWDKRKDISTELFNVLRLPETFIVDKNHNIVRKIIGSQLWLNHQAKNYIETLL